MEILNGMFEHEPKLEFGCGEDVGKLAEDESEVFNYRRGPARTVEIKRNVAYV